VGQRSPAESIAAIFQAFLSQRTWTQADLAREVGIQVPALKKHLAAMEVQGLPLQREEEHPHVYWSVPAHWFPGGVMFSREELTVLLRFLARAPQSPERDRLIESAVRSVSAGPGVAALTRVVQSSVEAEHTTMIEDSAARGATLHCRYLSAKGTESWRHLSVQRVLVGPPARFVAVCHRSERLKWFRVDNVLSARLDDTQPYRQARPEDLEALLLSSLDGFADHGPLLTHHFLVRTPESRWVAKNLLSGMTAEEVDAGLRVTVSTTALPIIARFVVGLGGAARCETPLLAEAVAELASGALQAQPGPEEGNG
jgi:predicted DNA-binding transcriptional regulator YafY